jgi:hypothetical protein
MATALEAAPRPTTALPAAPRPVQPWLLGPWLDLFFLANLGWPVIVLAAVCSARGADWDSNGVVQALVFWQLYFLSTPHRWITLSLVFLDEERFRERPKAFFGLGLFFILAVTAVVLGTGTTLLLVAVDYFWNAWHFAAQHSGIARIYARTARPENQGRGTWEKVLLRAFILFVIFRAGAMACAPNCTPNHPAEQPSLARHAAPFLFGVDAATLQGGLAVFVGQSELWLDAVMLALPLLLVLAEVSRFRPSAWGRLAYLGSVTAAYGTLLIAVHFHLLLLTLAVALAVALFHATEYLAVVSWAVQRKHAKSRHGAFAYLAPRWALALLTFIVVLALSAWMMDRHFQNQWAVVTIAVSFLHYAYDGMIWKARRPALRKDEG